jgi:SPP1 family predicted phage head-tail adaptor
MLSKLKQRAALLSRTLTPDGGGGFTESWQAIANIWIAIEPLGANARFGPDALEARVRHRIHLRARHDVVTGMRLTTATRSFAIRAVLAADAASPLMALLAEELPEVLP